MEHHTSNHATPKFPTQTPPPSPRRPRRRSQTVVPSHFPTPLGRIGWCIVCRVGVPILPGDRAVGLRKMTYLVERAICYGAGTSNLALRAGCAKFDSLSLDGLAFRGHFSYMSCHTQPKPPPTKREQMLTFHPIVKSPFTTSPTRLRWHHGPQLGRCRTRLFRHDAASLVAGRLLPPELPTLVVPGPCCGVLGYFFGFISPETDRCSS